MRVCGIRIGGLLDRYVARLFFLSYLAAFFLVVGLFLIVDMAVNLDEYLRADEAGAAPASLDVAQFYALQVPFLYLQMSPYVTLVAGMFTAAKMTRFNEVVAGMAAGVSVRRLFAVVLLGATLLSAGMFVLREWATDEIGARRDALLDQLRERRAYPIYENFTIYDRTGRHVRAREYHTGLEGDDPVLMGLSCRYQLEERSVTIVAQEARPLADGAWALEGGERLEVDERAQRPSGLAVLEEFRFTPEDVELSWKGRRQPMDLSFSESRALLERDPTNAQYRTLLHYHITFPLAGLVLLLIGLPFALRQERGKAGERIARGFFLCVAYFGFEFMTRTLGLQGQLGPLFAGWLPIVSFGALGVVLLGSMRS
jgi:lipopolysaccharide export system permease protein